VKLTKICCNKFTAFDDLSLDLSPGIDVFVGTNGTGKTHLMKLGYAACDITKSKVSFAEKTEPSFPPFRSKYRPSREAPEEQCLCCLRSLPREAPNRPCFFESYPQA
jgi:ABC-type branched-subunit amino acid transport system ATPase component